MDYAYVLIKGFQRIIYAGNNYNFPMSWLLPYDYPNNPPLITLEPEKDMEVYIGHPNITPPNIVTVPSLKRFKHDSTTNSLYEVHNEIINSFQSLAPLV